MNFFFNISILFIINFVYGTKLVEILKDKLTLHSLPFNNSKEAVVRVGLYIESFGKFLSSEMVRNFKYIDLIGIFQSFDIDFYIYCNWKDRKLAHSSPNLRLINSPTFLKSIWYIFRMIYIVSVQET